MIFFTSLGVSSKIRHISEPGGGRETGTGAADCWPGAPAPPAGDLHSLSLRLYLPFKPNHSFLKISNANEPEHQDIK